MDTADHATSTLTSLDWAMIAVYFSVLATVAWHPNLNDFAPRLFRR